MRSWRLVFPEKGIPLLSTRKSTRSRRTVARVAVAGALAAVPIAAVAVPAFADAPAAGDVDWPQRHGDGDHHRHHHGPGDGPGRPGPGGPGPFHRGPDGPQLPPTGSFG
ncbi:hypothetical protein NWFMUON74_00550 [Nocardia wallacei]|uniref:Uncharacterized protein n=1 Tax=Nocardia wallacei TaxID=480035 RepID=A0A7G1KD79_9NOCA|nr:hypothetical protein NWFMUON74_00550 [Nocardia wallacei]